MTADDAELEYLRGQVAAADEMVAEIGHYCHPGNLPDAFGRYLTARNKRNEGEHDR